jgi:8-oxo-dGTP pyrophosphatase MutT (NUDIX family)
MNILFRLFNFIRRTLQRLMGFATLGVKALIIDASGRVLLVEHTYVEGWHLPGGGVAIGEDPKAAVLREIMEETGLVVVGEPELFSVYTHKTYGASDYPILYVIRQFSIQPKQPCNEIKQIAWFALDQLPATITPSTKDRLNEVLQGLPPSPNW